MNSRRRNTSLTNSQRDMVQFLVKKTLDKHKIKPNRNLSLEDKRALRNIFQQLQLEVNEFLSQDNESSSSK